MHGKDDNFYLSNDAVSLKTDADDGILPWHNDLEDTTDNPFDEVPHSSHKASPDEIRRAESKRRLEEWRQKQRDMQNDVNIEVCIENIKASNEENNENADDNEPNEPVRPWNDIPFSEKTRVTATARLGLRYMMKKHKK